LQAFLTYGNRKASASARAAAGAGGGECTRAGRAPGARGGRRRARVRVGDHERQWAR